MKPELSSLYDRIIDDMVCGSIPMGDRINISELSKRYQVSNSPIREVLHQLQAEGFVEIAANRGARTIDLSRFEVESINEILGCIEKSLIDWEGIVEVDGIVESLVRINEQLTTVEKNNNYMITKIDHQFHYEMFKHHYNERFIRMWQIQRTTLDIFTSQLDKRKSRVDSMYDEHCLIIEMFSREDHAALIKLISEHHEASQDFIREQFKSLRK
ncbi:GntR family transcriptional regulator [Vibrio ulleungensis]|uniref:GntR family transcriptional regulator n=1 Tax=Vibrio ulleungensis TaxID=2807619 RepID=A0ABS2HC90_9VIBR|nr:GntR family transcriptional regulator [Vibrio ulleungensis]MBM7035218.1 GntR family transcriptional regulator [Vibrio ulleungensis]